MPYLTEEEIIEAYKIAPVHRMFVVHNPDWWSQLQNYNLPVPVKLPFDENIRLNMPLNIHSGKGIYMFVIEPNHHCTTHIDLKHLMYVGRVQEGNTGFNFFRRFNDYVSAIGNRTASRNKMRLTNLWPNQMYVYFFDLSNRSDQDIVDIEDNIINKVVPPLNEALKGGARLTRQVY
jgi:hypothetical protein